MFYQVHLVIGSAWLSMTLCSLLVAFCNPLNCIATHGKLKQLSKAEKPNGFMTSWVVPKSWFSHMYLLGLCTLPCYIYTMNCSQLTSSYHQAMVCFYLHLFRRCYESLYSTNYGSSTMHVFGYAAGLLHYTLAPLSVHAAMVRPAQEEPYGPSAITIRTLAFIIFIAASYFQAVFHRELSGSASAWTTTTSKEKGKVYFLPRGFGFDTVCCPHYTAEILIYASLSLLQLTVAQLSPTPSIVATPLIASMSRQQQSAAQFLPQLTAANLVHCISNSTLHCMLLWVTTNLSVVAQQQLQWYKGAFGGESSRSAAASQGKLNPHWRGWLPCLCTSCLSTYPPVYKGSVALIATLVLLSSQNAFGLTHATSAQHRLAYSPLRRNRPFSHSSSIFALSSQPSSDWASSVSGLTQAQLMDKDQCILVDYHDRIIGKATKYDAHRFTSANPAGLLHRAFSVFLFDKSGRLLLQQRASEKLTFPDVWTNTCCSHPLYGYEPNEVDSAESIAAGRCEGVKHAAVRKLEHELGLPASAVPITSMRYLTRLLYSAADAESIDPTGAWGESEVDYILFARLDYKLSDIAPAKEEVRDIKFVTPDELKAMLADPKLKWSPWFRIIVDKFLWAWWDSLDLVLAGKDAPFVSVEPLVLA